mgnify:CR=1 FL=1
MSGLFIDVEVAPEGLSLAFVPRATSLAWSDIARLHHDRFRTRLVITRHDGRVTEIDADFEGDGIHSVALDVQYTKTLTPEPEADEEEH